MNKFIFIAITSAIATAFLLRSKAQQQIKYTPMPLQGGNMEKHITNVFSRAKKQGL